MRIGIDIDDTISNTNDELVERAIQYDREHLKGKGFKNKNSFKFIDMFYWEEEDKQLFFNKHLEEAMNNALIKPHAKKVINKLKKEGNEIYIITHRSTLYFKNPYRLSNKWLKKNKVKYNKLIVNASEKDKVCEQYNIDIFIDDDINNYQAVSKTGINTLLFDSSFNRQFEGNRVTNWEEIYNIIHN